MSDPKRDGIDSPRADDNWGPGERADGTFNVIPPDKFAESIAERDADESAFAAMLDGGDAEIDDDLSDLDDDYSDFAPKESPKEK
jgi:hypothetical protein